MTESSENTIFLPSLAIGGYRSFGDIQYFEKFSKINLFIGRNNCGKSNVLRVISNHLQRNEKTKLSKIDKHKMNEDNAIYFPDIHRVFDLTFNKKYCYNYSNEVYFMKFIEIIRKHHHTIKYDKTTKEILSNIIINAIGIDYISKNEGMKYDEYYRNNKKEVVMTIKRLNKSENKNGLRIKSLLIKKLKSNYNSDNFLREFRNFAPQEDEDWDRFIDNNIYESFLLQECYNPQIIENLPSIIRDDLLKRLGIFFGKINDYFKISEEYDEEIIQSLLSYSEVDDYFLKEYIEKALRLTKDENCSKILDKETCLIESNRKITNTDIDNSKIFNGGGLIERLHKIESPRQEDWEDSKKFQAIENFLQEIISDKDARIKIPYDWRTSETINVIIDNQPKSLGSLGSGIEEIIIIAAAATLHQNQIICIEEPELHLNPLLQKKLMRYLSEETNNQYFIATHSAALLDTPNAEIYHLKLENGQTIVQRATLDEKNRDICADLGYHPSDFLQSNCIIWVEGPSDRLYINWWLKQWWEKEKEKEKKTELIEGVHYSIMFYGGRLLSHLEGDCSDSIEDRIALFRINQRSFIVMDSDKENETEAVSKTKQEIEEEFKERNKGLTWITKGREIENYLEESMVHDAIKANHKNTIDTLPSGKYKNLLSKVVISTGRDGKQKNTDASKIEIAKYITQNENNKPNFDELDLEERIEGLYKFIKESQPDTEYK